jgi:hypothetical protein
MNPLPRIYADFNKAAGPGRVILTCVGTRADIEKLNLDLTDGMQVVLYMPDVDENGVSDPLEVSAIIRRDEKNGWWVGDFDWKELDHLSRKDRKTGQV